MKRRHLLIGSGVVVAVVAAGSWVGPRILGEDRDTDLGVVSDEDLALDSLRGPLTGERFYFVLPDRFANGDPGNDTGGIPGDRTDHGFDPTDIGFYHGGDLVGLTEHLDYIDGLGMTALWLTPVMVNQPVQGPPGEESAAYHGYWITDFTDVDPHLGTMADLERLIEEAHARDLKVFLDIITNHTADVISYAEGSTTYISKGEVPYVDVDGVPFDDSDHAGSPDFPKVNIESFPYTPVVDPELADIKSPDWLNDLTMYHNRGDSTFSGESSTHGDFFGLDDLWTERPEVVEGMVEIYTDWIDIGVDGFRIDTVKHVNMEFWQEWAPAISEHAAAAGREDFFMFGEVFEANAIATSEYTTTGALPAVLDFGFQAAATAYTQGSSAARMASFYGADDWYTDADSNAYALPTFLGNHDMGRFAQFLGGAAILHRDLPERVAFGHTLMFLTRGQPVVYYGDEQGFIGRRGDKDARQSMFATQVPQFEREPVVTGEPGSRHRYDTDAPLYAHIAELAALRAEHPTLADGAQITRHAEDGPGSFAFSRIRPSEGIEYVVAVNNDILEASATVQTYSPGMSYEPLYGTGQAVASTADGTIEVTVPPLSAVVYRGTSLVPGVSEALSVRIEAGALSGRAEVSAELSAADLSAARLPFAQVTFAVRERGSEGEWTVLGTDDAPPYRVYVDVATLPQDVELEFRAVVKPLSGPISAASTTGRVQPPAGPPAPGQPSSVSIPGSLNPELGCASEWEPSCAQAMLAYDESTATWRGTFDLPAGSYEFKWRSTAAGMRTTAPVVPVTVTTSRWSIPAGRSPSSTTTARTRSGWSRPSPLRRPDA